ncbi:MAG: hypothetical protein CMH83_04360 [Nocardioides sp.]|nr:hypothetical protein [Nocardioides sp.]
MGTEHAPNHVELRLEVLRHLAAVERTDPARSARVRMQALSLGRRHDRGDLAADAYQGALLLLLSELDEPSAEPALPGAAQDAPGSVK